MRCPNCGYWQSDDQGEVCTRCGHSRVQEGRDGPAWEHRQWGIDFQAILATLSAVLFRPVETFRRMRRTGGLGGPLWYAVILGTIGGWFSILWNSFFHSLGVLGEGLGDEEIFGYVAFLIMAVLMPSLIAVGVFIGAAITHVCLLIVGGATQGFETTFRVSSYVGGSTELFNVVPICGGLVGGLWYIVAMIFGVREAHEISTGKAVVAVLLPIVVCCGCAGVVMFMVFGAAMSEVLKNL